MKSLASIFGGLLLSCVSVLAGPRLSAAEAARIADADARSHQYDLRQFLPRRATYFAKQDSWLILYREKKSPIAFDVQVHDKTKKIYTTFICSPFP